MDVLVAMGSSAAYFYSVLVTIALTMGSTALGTHVYFETAAVSWKPGPRVKPAPPSKS
jgi:Cu+-exporting ATPase